MTRKWKTQVLKRKNFAPTFLITIALWGSLVLLVLYANPYTFGVIHLFFVLFFFAFFLTASILLVSTRRGFLVASTLTLVLFMKFIDVDTFTNLVIVVIFFGLIELYAIQGKSR